MRLRILAFVFFCLCLGKLSFAYEYVKADSTVVKNGCKTIHFQEKSVPWDIYILEVDLTNKHNKIKVGLANDKIAWIDPAGNAAVNKETLGHMIQRRNDSGEDVIGGINADFFNMANGMQFNTTATQGEIASTGITRIKHTALYTDDNGEPYIGLADMVQKASMAGYGEFEIKGTNIIRQLNYLVIYNHFMGQNQSFTNEWGTELLLEPLDSGLINGLRNYKIVDKATHVTMTSPAQIILSGNGTAYTYLSNAQVGNYLQIYTEFPSLEKKHITEMIGGWGHIVKEGVNCAISSIEEEGTMYHEEDRHPRSAVVYNKDKSKLYLVAVDGRSDVSKGMDLSELADFMITELNGWEGMNFDGGGSTTLMSGTETVNTPSAGAQRAIPNALLIVNEPQSFVAQEYSFETSSTTYLQENSKLYYETDEENNCEVWVLEADLSNPGIKLNPVSANNKVGWTDAFGIAHKNKKNLSEILTDKIDDENKVLIAGINASPFEFKSGSLNKVFVSNGIIASLPENGKSSPGIWFDQNNVPSIGNLDFKVKIKASNGQEMDVNSVNDVRWIDHLVLYNSFIGDKSITNQWGAEVLLEPEGESFVNGNLVCKVIKKEYSQVQGTGKMPFTGSQLVLSGNSKAYDFIKDNIEPGQEIELITSLENAGTNPLKTVISGACQVLKNGESSWLDSLGSSEAKIVLGNDLRTAIGYNQNKSKLFFFVSEKYSETNNGLPLNGLTALMEKYQIYDGLCLDGGVNSTLIADNSVVNMLPQNEASIANGLVIEYLKSTGILPVTEKSDFKIFPNPASDFFYLEIEPENSGNLLFELHDVAGKLISSCAFSVIGNSKNRKRIDVPTIDAGIYFYRVTSEKTEMKSGKIIIEKNN